VIAALSILGWIFLSIGVALIVGPVLRDQTREED